ncbi:DegV family protein [Egicoccus sp. AB-alg2]|uniref:DegV family protein n=1 Tax=Egicoccus sp. AB-alg2 TaxID=3242693 RepID=UPI00359DFCCB
MGRGVAVVTDSTCDLPADLVERLGIRVVPLSVTFGDETLISGVTISNEAFYDRLAATSRLPTTSQPAPAWFEEAYADCVDDGHDAVVSLHVSAALSGTVDLARHRAGRAGLPVEVVDTQLVGGALGLAALRAHRVAEAGGTVAEVVEVAEAVRDRSLSLLVVDDLSHLKRGGRLTGAQAAVGSVLRVKPVLQVVEGRVEVRERTRTWQRALDRVAEMAVEHAAGREVDVVVAHAVAAERAASLWSRLEGRLEVGERLETHMGPIVGAHVGPGAVGIAVVPRADA